VLETLAILLAGVAAGTINAVVGSGTLITFPVLLAFGYAPVTANVSNTIGLVPGSVAGAVGYRRELAGQRARAVRLGVLSVAGGIAGAALLLTLPDEAFKAIVPAFIVVALVLIVLQPRLSARLAHRRAHTGEGWPARLGVLGTGVYGGYFGAAQGIMLLGVLGVALPDDLQRVNALKNVLAGLVNLVSGVVFVAVADVAWEAVALIAAGAVVGGHLGARHGRRLSPEVLRGAIVVVGLAAIAQLVL
jgi:uncharacterized membrane protein YfcA